MQSREAEFAEYRNQAKVLWQAGNIHSKNKDWIKAKADFYLANVIGAKIETPTPQDHAAIGDCFLNMGFCHGELNDKKSEIHAYLESINHYEKIAPQDRGQTYYRDLIEYNYYNLIYSYLEINQPENAWANWNKLVDMIKSLKSVPYYDSLMFDLLTLAKKVTKICRGNKNLSEAEKWYLALIKVAKEMNQPDTRCHETLADIWFDLATHVYDETGSRTQEISAYHAAIAEINMIPAQERTPNDCRVCEQSYYNLSLMYYNRDQIIQALKLAIEWLERIELGKRTAKDKRELAICHMKLAQLVEYTPESVVACAQALQDQPETDYAKQEYFEQLAKWKAYLANASKVKEVENKTLVEVQKNLAELNQKTERLQQQTEQLSACVTTLFELEENRKKRKAVALKGNANSLFHASNQPAKEPEQKKDNLSVLR